MKTTVYFITVLLNALSAGFFFAWSASVVLGTKKVGDVTYLEAMQSINREILNPVFFIVFFGSLIALVANTCFQFNNRSVFWLILIATVIYFFGTFGVTAFGNVPLNNELDALNINQLNASKLKRFRTYYETNWNQYHNIRTLSNLVSFTLLLISIFIKRIF
ncbi:DUF1772 domain-containing protein [Psychroserpens sp. XS_ASV72]|uniref:anthrone oxygenase family protein n=1 Tax=Psychroserpens sp. XS_ASV72 TaxID=3241293 RepID=UPI003515BA41